MDNPTIKLFNAIILNYADGIYTSQKDSLLICVLSKTVIK